MLVLPDEIVGTIRREYDWEVASDTTTTWAAMGNTNSLPRVYCLIPFSIAIRIFSNVSGD